MPEASRFRRFLIHATSHKPVIAEAFALRLSYRKDLDVRDG
ncbi:MAG: hypothetical protein ACLP8A_06845 [Methylovirgula sp.]